MKVFISWSGDRSKLVALYIKEWIPLIIQYVDPWVSDKDIKAGDRWAQTIAGELEAANFGIICITPENINSEWILFEAGALSKSMLDAKVIPLLFDIELSELSGPLSQFQALKLDQLGMMSVLKSVNAVADSKAAESTINELVPALWGKLQEKLDSIPHKHKESLEKHKRPQAEILEELVSQVRGLGTRLRESEIEIMERDSRYLNSKYRDLEPRMFDEMLHVMMDVGDGELSLLLLAGFVRDRMPWLAEVMVESHRELKSANSEQAKIIINRITRFVKQTTRGAFGEKYMGRNKFGQMMMMDLPHLVDRALSQLMDSRQIFDEKI